MKILEQLLLRYPSIVVLDVETTGFDYLTCDVIELACLQLQAPDQVRSYDWLINIGKPVPKKITAITQITNDMLTAEGLPRRHIVDSLSSLIFSGDRTLLIAHNANFDLHFLQAMFKQEGQLFDWSRVDAIDTLSIMKDRKPYPHKLSDAITAYGLEQDVQNSHRAIDDVLATFKVFEKMCEENPDVTEYINLFGYNPKYSIRQKDRLPGIRYLAQPYDSPTKLYCRRS